MRTCTGTLLQRPQVSSIVVSQYYVVHQYSTAGDRNNQETRILVLLKMQRVGGKTTIYNSLFTKTQKQPVQSVVCILVYMVQAQQYTA